MHHAVTALRSGEVNLALVAGVNAALSPDATLKMGELGMLSSGGVCRVFNAGADGFVRGEGCGVVILKRLDEAVEDGDRIWAVIRGSGVNQSGMSAGPTAPSGLAQRQVIEQALASAGVEPADVDYLEAHGSSSELGDAIELEASAAVYGRDREAGRPLLVGSVKTNIGHTESASGMAGLIKTVMAMQSGVIPAHLHFEEPSRHIEWDRLPLLVTDSATEWPHRQDRGPLAAVSAFGLTGANAHVVIEGYRSSVSAPGMWAPGAPVPVDFPSPELRAPAPDRAQDRGVARILPLSAKSHEALRSLARDYLAWADATERGPGDSTLPDAAWTAGVGRAHFSHRAGVVFSDTHSLRNGLQALIDTTDSTEPSAARRVGFWYEAEVDDSPAAVRALYESEPVARAILDRCDEVLRAEHHTSLLAARPGDGAGGSVEDAVWGQPAVYALQCALTALWSSVGIRPDVVLGHGVGELAAAQAAGVFSLEAGMRLAAARSRLTERASGGSALHAEDGSTAFEKALKGSAPSRPSIPVLSGATGEPAQANQSWDAAYWVDQALLPATSAGGLSALSDSGADVVVNIGGSGSSLGATARSDAAPLIIPGPAKGTEMGIEPSEAFTRAVARAYEMGLDVAFGGLFVGELRSRVSIPTYPFQRRRYWLDRAQASAVTTP